MGDHIISFLDICAMRGQLVLAKAPSIPAIDNKTVYCTGAHKRGANRCIVLDDIELCQCMQWCLNGKKLIESYRRNNDAREPSCFHHLAFLLFYIFFHCFSTNVTNRSNVISTAP